jgi:methyltransferase (TIGR00027 family)
MRAVHRIVDEKPAVIDDSISTALFETEAREIIAREPGRLLDSRATELRGHVLARSVFAERRMEAAVTRGVRQCVILGAGYDTFAYRQPAWMRDVRLVEVDAGPTQIDKRERLRRAGIPEPANVRYAAIDFKRRSLAGGLLTAGLDAAQPTFFSWLGVTVYLTREAIDAVFAFVSALPSETEIAFTFSERVVDDDGILGRRVASAGEPFVTFFDVDELESLLRSHGFAETSILSLVEIRALLGERNGALAVPNRRGLASAIVRRAV